MQIEYAQAVGAQLSEMAMSKEDWEEATRLCHDCEKMELQDLFFPFYKVSRSPPYPPPIQRVRTPQCPCTIARWCT
jgi:hypothetical protein